MLLSCSLLAALSFFSRLTQTMLCSRAERPTRVPKVVCMNRKRIMTNTIIITINSALMSIFSLNLMLDMDYIHPLNPSATIVTLGDKLTDAGHVTLFSGNLEVSIDDCHSQQNTST